MIKKYIVEKNNQMPLCCIENNIYFDFLTGQVVDKKNTIKFIENGLQRKTMDVVDIDLVIYAIKKNIKDFQTMFYIYQINGCSNYLEPNIMPLNKTEQQYVIDKLTSKEYIKELIWE